MRDDRVSWLNVMIRASDKLPAAQAAVDAAWQPQQRRLMDEVDDVQEREQIGRQRPLLVPSPQGFSTTRNGFRGAALTLMLLVGAMLCVTAANTSTLLLLRLLGRSRELGVRLALGAGRWRLARAVLLEGVLLSAGGGRRRPAPEHLAHRGAGRLAGAGRALADRGSPPAGRGRRAHPVPRRRARRGARRGWVPGFRRKRSCSSA